MRISKLEETLSNARVIDESQLDNSKVLVLSKVKIKNQVNGMVMDYMIVARFFKCFKSWGILALN